MEGLFVSGAGRPSTPDLPAFLMLLKKNHKNQPRTMKNYETTVKTIKPTKNHEKSWNYLENHKNQPRTMENRALCTLLIFSTHMCGQTEDRAPRCHYMCGRTHTDPALSFYLDPRHLLIISNAGWPLTHEMAPFHSSLLLLQTFLVSTFLPFLAADVAFFALPRQMAPLCGN